MRNARTTELIVSDLKLVAKTEQLEETSEYEEEEEDFERPQKSSEEAVLAEPSLVTFVPVQAGPVATQVSEAAANEEQAEDLEEDLILDATVDDQPLPAKLISTESIEDLNLIGKPLELKIKRACCKICYLVCVVYPIFAALFAAIFTVPLVTLAGWDSADSFFEVLIELSNANNDVLTNNSDATEDTLKASGVSVTLITLSRFISIGIIGCFLGLFTGGPLDRPIIKKIFHLQHRVKEYFKIESPEIKATTIEQHLETN